MRIILLSILFSTALIAQIGPPGSSGFTPVVADPTGNACQANSVALRTPSGQIYTCVSNSYALYTGGGAGTGTVTSVIAGCGLSGGTITVSGTIAENIVTAAHNGSYAILTGDCGKALSTNTAAAWTIAQAGSAGFLTGWFVDINNVGSGALTVTATTSTFYGGPTANISGSVLTVPANTSARIISDGTNYQVLAGGGGSGLGVTSLGATLSGTVTATDSGSTSVFTGTQTGNITSFILAGLTPGKTYSHSYTQDVTGTRTFGGASGLSVTPCFVTAPTVTNTFFGYATSASALTVTGSTNNSGYGCAPTGTVPAAAPSSGLLSYIDPTDIMPHWVNPSTTYSGVTPLSLIGVPVLGISNPSDNKWIAYVDIHGVQQRTQPAFSNFSGTLGASQMTGTSGGVPYFNGASSWATSAALTANLPVIGGGAGAAPTVGTVSGNTTEFATFNGAATAARCIDTDINGNLQVTGSDCGSGSGGSSAGASLFSTTGSTTVTQTSATTLIGTVTGSTTIPVNTFTAGQPLMFHASGFYTTPATPASLTIDLKIGGTTRISTGTVVQIASVTLGVWNLDCLVTTRTAGASGTQIANCIFVGTGSTLTPGEAPMQVSSTWSVDTTATQAIDLQATWSTAVGAPTITSTNVAAWIPGAPVSSVSVNGGSAQTGAVSLTSIMVRNAANTVTTGDQNFSGATSLEVPVSAGATAGVAGRIAYDSNNGYVHVPMSGSDSTVTTSIAVGTFTETQTCTASSAATKTYTATITAPVNSITQLGDHLRVLVDLQLTVPGSNAASTGFDLLLDGANFYTMDVAPNAASGALTGAPYVASWDIWPTTVAGGANSTLNVTFTGNLQGSGVLPGTRFFNGTAAPTTVNLGATHTIGLAMECTSATGTTTAAKLLAIRLVRQ